MRRCEHDASRTHEAAQALLTGVVALLFVAAGLALLTEIAARGVAARYPPVGRRVEVGGGAIHVLERPAQGEERGAALLIHGASGNAADMIVALGERLANRGFRVLSCDRPGHGWSDRIGGNAVASPASQADLLSRAAQGLGVQRPIVIAHSLGAITGLALALDYPELVRAVVLIAPVSHPWSGGVAWYYTAGAHPLLGPPLRHLVALPVGSARMSSAVAGVFAPNRAPRGFIDATRLPLVLRPRHFRANCEDVAYAVKAVAELSPRYSGIRAPTAIVTGDSDAVVYAQIHAAGLARDIPGARLAILEGVGHAPHHAAPDRVVEAVLEVAGRADRNAAAAA